MPPIAYVAAERPGTSAGSTVAVAVHAASVTPNTHDGRTVSGTPRTTVRDRERADRRRRSAAT
jgi:hypothetical protein